MSLHVRSVAPSLGRLGGMAPHRHPAPTAAPKLPGRSRHTRGGGGTKRKRAHIGRSDARQRGKRMGGRGIHRDGGQLDGFGQRAIEAISRRRKNERMERNLMRNCDHISRQAAEPEEGGRRGVGIGVGGRGWRTRCRGRGCWTSCAADPSLTQDQIGASSIIWHLGPNIKSIKKINSIIHIWRLLRSLMHRRNRELPYVHRE
jgi:hypothetical protein